LGKTKRTLEEIWRAQESVRKHDALVIFSKAVKPSVHSSEEEDFNLVYQRALERLAKRDKNKELR